MTSRSIYRYMGFALVLFSQSAFVFSQEDKCKDTTIWEDDARITSLLKVERINAHWTKPEQAGEESKNPGYTFAHNKSKTAYFVEPGKKYSELIVLSRHPRRALRISVPEWKHRPLDAEWENDHILRIETSFNPHNGAYWRYDLITEKILISKFGYDNSEAMRQCENDE